MGIRQEPDETTDSYIERAERTGLGHALEEQYKVQATASGLLDMWRGKVLAREPKTFQELRTVIAKVKLEMSSSTPQQATSADNGITNLCAMLMTHMTELTNGLKSEVNAIRAFQYNNQRPTGREYQNERQRERQGFRCKGCGESCSARYRCPAQNTQCGYCLKWNHYETVCRQKRRAQQNPQNANKTPVGTNRST